METIMQRGGFRGWLRGLSRVCLLIMVVHALCGRALDIHLADGKTIRNVTVIRTEPDRVTVAHAKGGGTILFSDMAESSRKQLGYDTAQAAEHAKQQALRRDIAATGIRASWAVEEVMSPKSARALVRTKEGETTAILSGRDSWKWKGGQWESGTLYPIGSTSVPTAWGPMAYPVFAVSMEFAMDAIHRVAEEGRRPTTGPNVAHGSAWVTREGVVVTCFHVVGTSKRIRVHFQKGEAIWLRVLASDPENDLALLLPVEETVLPPGLDLAPALPGLGEAVFTMGYPLSDILGQEPRVTSGVVSAHAGIQDDPRNLQITVPLQAGNSGGALINSKGQVVGVIASKLSARNSFGESANLPENVNFAVKADRVAQLLAKHGKPNQPAGPPPAGSRDLAELVKAVEASVAVVIAE